MKYSNFQKARTHSFIHLNINLNRIDEFTKFSALLIKLRPNKINHSLIKSSTLINSTEGGQSHGYGGTGSAS